MRLTGNLTGVILGDMEFFTAWPVIRKILIGIAAALVVATVIWFLRPTSPGTSVVVATRNLKTGDRLSPAATTHVTVPPNAAPADALTRDQLPDVWDGPAITQGTIITESLVSGSVLGRELSRDHAQISVVLERIHLPDIAPGDFVDVWAIPENCDDPSCSAFLLAGKVRIVSMKDGDASQWDTAQPIQVDLVVNSQDQGTILGHARTGTLGLTLRSTDTRPPSIDN
ncbi:hypothetical protein G7Y41_08200 [Schaalia sp. ZJ405]|uniref:hypothetical protein n=1 Tax=Schaalia sp. ZJ405 TaxID=2709403 RepID=UPI0013EC3717|nr:hypothetical protein [Schaalia sp. ZJ405]QPK81014.1 hypothetical protein G7Y41_08200 [Schaalia sp. ZJ405]